MNAASGGRKIRVDSAWHVRHHKTLVDVLKSGEIDHLRNLAGLWHLDTDGDYQALVTRLANYCNIDKWEGRIRQADAPLHMLCEHDEVYETHPCDVCSAYPDCPVRRLVE